MGEGLAKLNLQIPILTVETGIEGASPNYLNISADNYKMGQELGKKILQDMQEDDGVKTVTVIKEYMQRDSVTARYEGLVDTLEGAGQGVKIDAVFRQKGDFDLSLLVGKALHTSGEYIAALDKFCTEEAAKAWEENRSGYEADGVRFKIYGIGNTAQTVNDLDNGRLCALVYQNEFNMGYEGLQALVDKEEKGYFDDQFDIRYELVTSETLYEAPNERLLFPSV